MAEFKEITSSRLELTWAVILDCLLLGVWYLLHWALEWMGEQLNISEDWLWESLRWTVTVIGAAHTLVKVIFDFIDLVRGCWQRTFK